MRECWLDVPDVSELAFWPSSESIPEPLVVDCGDARLSCYYHQCAADACTVVFFHGNGEVVANYANVLPRVFEIIGCNTFLAEFRGYGGSTGQPGLGRLLSDCRQILSRIPCPPERMILFGRSLGCVPAVEMASLAPTARGLLLESGIADLYDYVIWLLSARHGKPGSPCFPLTDGQIQDLEREVHIRANLQAKLSGFRGYGVVTCSSLDLTRRQNDSQKLFSWLPGPRRMYSLCNGDHNSLLMKNIKLYCEQIDAMAKGTFQGE